MNKRHFEFKEEDIANGKYTAMELMQPLWCTVDIYNDVEKYNKDLEQFTLGQRRIFALVWYEAELSNGGHDQFFYNPTGIVWKDVLEGLEMIGAKKCLENFRKTIEMFDGNLPFDNEERQEVLEKLENFNYNLFIERDKCFCEIDLHQAMDEYVKTHASEFVVNGDYCYNYY